MTIDEFKNMDLRAGKILEAERVQDSAKLIKLKVDIGETDGAGLPAPRQIIAGVGQEYEPENLIGKEVIIVANLEPRVLMGLESHGMLLAAHDEDGKPVILTVMREVPPGAKIS